MSAILLEPASAIAAGICLTARTIAHGHTVRHPRPCGWCDYDVADLRTLVDGFNAWAGYNGRTYAQLLARIFQGLPHREQVAQVLEAQSFPAVEPMTEADSAPAHDGDDEETPKWLR